MLKFPYENTATNQIINEIIKIIMKWVRGNKPAAGGGAAHVQQESSEPPAACGQGTQEAKGTRLLAIWKGVDYEEFCCHGVS